MRLKRDSAVTVITATFCSILFHVVLAKKSLSSDEEPDYYPRVNPNPNNIEELNVHDIAQYFDLFTRFYEIDYKDSAHENDSYVTFADNIRRVIVMNKFTAQAKFGINEFSHLKLEDFTDKYTGFNDTGIDNTNVKQFGYNSTQGTPTTLDWRILGISPTVRHQGPCKSSYVFSALANIEAQASKHYNLLPTLSEQQAYDCEPTGNCRYGGMPHKVMESIMSVGGIEEQMSYIYNPMDHRECKVNTSLMILKVTNIVRLRPAYEDSLVALLALYGPLVTAIYVSESVKNYYKGILEPTDCDKKPNHAVLLVGYGISDDNVPYWILKNSWGKLWGENGYFRLARGVWACHIGEYVVTAIVEPIVKETTTTTTTTTTSSTTTTTIAPPPSDAAIAATSQTSERSPGPIPVIPVLDPNNETEIHAAKITITTGATRDSDKITSPDSECDSSGSDENGATTQKNSKYRTALIGLESRESKLRKGNDSPRVDSSDSSDEKQKKSSDEDAKAKEKSSDDDDSKSERGPLTGVIADEARLRADGSADEEDSDEIPLAKADDGATDNEYKVVLTDLKALEAKEKLALAEEEKESKENDKDEDKENDGKKSESGSSASVDTDDDDAPRITQGYLDNNA